MPTNCYKSADILCHVCGELCTKVKRNAITPLGETAYELYYGFSIDKRDESLFLKICCNSCSRTLSGWLERSHKTVPFTTLISWTEPQNHKNC